METIEKSRVLRSYLRKHQNNELTFFSIYAASFYLIHYSLEYGELVLQSLKFGDIHCDHIIVKMVAPQPIFLAKKFLQFGPHFIRSLVLIHMKEINQGILATKQRFPRAPSILSKYFVFSLAELGTILVSIVIL